MPALTFRPYTPADLAGCLALFDSNVPTFFAQSERADYQAFLQDPQDRGEYFVLERGGELAACGGVFVKAGGEAGLSWGMVRGDLHGQRLGAALVAYRLGWLREHRPGVREARIETSQHTEGYYARHGFLTVSRTPDGFAPGMDQIEIILGLPNSLKSN